MALYSQFNTRTYFATPSDALTPPVPFPLTGSTAERVALSWTFAAGFFLPPQFIEFAGRLLFTNIALIAGTVRLRVGGLAGTIFGSASIPLNTLTFRGKLRCLVFPVANQPSKYLFGSVGKMDLAETGTEATSATAFLTLNVADPLQVVMTWQAGANADRLNSASGELQQFPPTGQF